MNTIELLCWRESGFTATTVGLQIDPAAKPTIDDFVFYAHCLPTSTSILWILGDLLNEAERRFGEDYAQMSEITGYERGTLYNSKYVASRIEFSRRREELSFSHHQAVAHLEPAEQDRWLALAIDEEWTRAELRQRVDAKHIQSQPEWSEPEPTWNEIVESDRPARARARELLALLLEDLELIEEVLAEADTGQDALKTMRTMILDLIAELVEEPV